MAMLLRSADRKATRSRHLPAEFRRRYRQAAGAASVRSGDGSVRPAPHGDALRPDQHLLRGRGGGPEQGPTRPLQGEALGLPAPDPGAGSTARASCAAPKCSRFRHGAGMAALACPGLPLARVPVDSSGTVRGTRSRQPPFASRRRAAAPARTTTRASSLTTVARRRAPSGSSAATNLRAHPAVGVPLGGADPQSRLPSSP